MHIHSRKAPASSILLAFCLLIAVFGAAAPAFAQPTRVEVTAYASDTDVVPGGQFAIAVVFKHDEGWHIHTHAPKVPSGWDFSPHPTIIASAPIAGLIPGPIQWPAAHPVMVDLVGSGKPQPYEVFGGRAVAFLPYAVSKDATEGPTKIAVTVDFQACDDRTCLPPETIELEVSVTVTAMAARGAPATRDPSIDELFKGFDQSVFATVSTWPGAVAAGSATVGAVTGPAAPDGHRFNELGVSFTVPGGPLGLAALFGIGALGGLLMNLTPCVLPVIPIKIMGLSQAAGNPRRSLILGIAMSLGVIAFWMGIGVLISGLKVIGAVSELFSYPGFNIGIGVFIALMGLGMMGLFTLQLPQSVYAITPNHHTLPGSFLFGIMTAVLGTPCFGPFAGGVAAWATRQPTVVAMSFFGAVGLGMALPYLLLSARPSWVAKVPRTGPGSELVKQVMGLLMLAAAAFFVGVGLIALVAERPYLGRQLHWWFVAAICLAAGVWLVARVVRVAHTGVVKALCILAAVGLAVAPIWWAYSHTQEAAASWSPGESTDSRSASSQKASGPWREYAPEEVDAARAAGKVVVLDFTAEWCLNCKVLEATVLSQTQVIDALSAPNVAAFRVDLTSRKAAGWQRLKDLGEVGIPLLAILPANGAEPFKSNSYTPDVVVGAIRSAAAAGPVPAPGPGSSPAR